MELGIVIKEIHILWSGLDILESVDSGGGVINIRNRNWKKGK